ncbi:MAG: peptide chain release factor N(5)-glutamine methyltransferase [Clostridia bacterium]|nr:peptide chain release factor N(5)-glutamine methyltransferase [Clostridia bacterium]
MVSLVNKYYALLSGFTETPLQDARALLSYVLQSDALLVWRDLTHDEEQKMLSLIEKRKTGIPIAYLVGEKEFMSLPFFVNEHTLIPRPDTETLVEELIDLFKDKSPRILDLCCGTGCIGISLAHFIPQSNVTMLDVSPEALEIAEKNILRHHLSNRVRVKLSDVLKDEIEDKYDLIVSNPPYIETETLQTLDVSKHEPILALDGGSDGLNFYRVIIPKAAASLTPCGTLAFEIGYNQGQSVPALLSPYFKDVTLKQDLSGNDRVVIAQNPI